MSPKGNAIDELFWAGPAQGFILARALVPQKVISSLPLASNGCIVSPRWAGGGLHLNLGERGHASSHKSEDAEKDIHMTSGGCGRRVAASSPVRCVLSSRSDRLPLPPKRRLEADSNMGMEAG